MPGPPKNNQLSPVYGFLRNPSMIDFPGRISGVVFVAGCNFKCGFCHNAALMGQSRPGLPWSKLEEYCDLLTKQWADGMVISGGEPTLLGDGLKRLIDFIKNFGLAVKLDTNGSRPEVIRSVLSRLDYVAMDIKCSLPRYPMIAGFKQPDRIAESIELLKESGVEYEFRTTIVESVHNLAEIAVIGDLVRPCRRYVLQTFIPRSDLPGEEMRNQARTSPEYLHEAKAILENNGCAREILIR